MNNYKEQRGIPLCSKCHKNKALYSMQTKEGILISMCYDCTVELGEIVNDKEKVDKFFKDLGVRGE